MDYELRIQELEAQIRQLEHWRFQQRVRETRVWKGWRMAVVVAVLLVGASSLVRANSPPGPDEAVPRQVPYRGTLRQNGQLVSSATVPMTFSLYDDPTAGNLLWSESQTVAVNNGVFAVSLGDCTPTSSCSQGALAPVLAKRPPAVYLQITANQQTLAGRQRLLSVPYAERAAEAMQAASADGPAPDGGIDMRLNALQGAHDNLAATVVDLASNQTIAGNKTFTGTLTTSGGLAVLEPDGGAFSVNGVPAMIFGGWYCNPGGGYPTGSVNPLTVHRPVRQVSRARSCSRPAASPAVRACARS